MNKRTQKKRAKRLETEYWARRVASIVPDRGRHDWAMSQVKAHNAIIAHIRDTVARAEASGYMAPMVGVSFTVTEVREA